VPQTLDMSSPVNALHALGGIATFAELRAAAPRKGIEASVRRGEIVKDRRGRYVLATTSDHLRVAHEMSAVLSHESAALHHGWKVKHAPEVPTVTVRRKRHLTSADRGRATPHYNDLPADCIPEGGTTPMLTVLDCARHLAFDRALAVTDSALRNQDLTLGAVRSEAARLRGPGAAAARKVADHAIYVSANPLESVLRAIVINIPGYSFVPHLCIWDNGLYATVDLGDPKVKVVLKAEGYAFHGGRKEFKRDCPQVQRVGRLGVDRVPFHLGARDVRPGLRHLDLGIMVAVFSRGAAASRSGPPGMTSPTRQTFATLTRASKQAERAKNPHRDSVYALLPV